MSPSRRLDRIARLVAALLAAGCSSKAELDRVSSAPEPIAHSAAGSAVSSAVSNGFVRLARGAHPLARPELDLGRLDPATRIANLSLFFRPSPTQRKERDALASALVDPKSPSYHAWLTPEDYAARFGAQPADIARASAWLSKQGFTVHRTSRLGTRVTFSATVGELESAFQTEMHQYRVAGLTHFAMATAPAIPNDLADVVLAIRHTHDFFPRPASHLRNQAAFGARGDHPQYKLALDGGSVDVLGPPDWAQAYGLTQLYSPGIGGKAIDGTGVTIGVVGTAQIANSDVAAFRATFNLPVRPVTMTLTPDTGPSAPGEYGGGVEAILDVELSGGIAKGATINYVYVGEDDGDVDDATHYLIEENLASVITESYGGCEAGTVPSDADVTEVMGTAANLLGITYMAAAGDSGAADCSEFGLSGLYVDMPGAFPGVTSVGGTQFPQVNWSDAGTLAGYPTPEQVWNEGNDPYSYYGVGAGGGGISQVFARPFYQTALTTCTPVGTLPTGGPAPVMRQVPDVALSAAGETPGYYIECTFDETTEDCSGKGGDPEGTGIGGTSASAPSFAGFVALLNQAAGERLGNINPMLYTIAASAAGSGAFHDVSQGSNEVVCGAVAAGDAGSPEGGEWPDAGCAANGLYGYAAAPGYDCASGLGSIDGYNLATAWTDLARTTTALVASPNETTEGADVTLTATVTGIGASSHAVAGEVTFVFESFTVAGETDLSWELGSAAVTSGTATLKTPIPPGLVKPGKQFVDVVAVYAGDAYHLASTSPKVGVGFEALSFAIVPATATMAINGSKTFTTTGGVDPVRYFIDYDTTATFTGGAQVGENDGGLTVGPQAGFVIVEALDKFGVEALARITVGDPGGPAPWADGGVFLDAAVPPTAVVDASTKHDSSVADAEGPMTQHKDAGQTVEQDSGTPGTVSGGGCSVASADHDNPWTFAPLGTLLALVALRQRRQTRRI